MKALLPVAGNGTRMYPLGITTPKCLLPILNTPLLVWTLRSLQSAGIDTVVCVVSAGRLGQLTAEFIRTVSIEGLQLEVATQEQQLGTAHVAQMAKDYFKPDEQFIMLYGDDLYGPENIKKVIAHDGLAVIGMPVDDPEKWGIFQTDESGSMISVIEKPTEYVGNMAHIGCMKLDTRIFDLFDTIQVSSRGELELTDSLNALAKLSPIQVLPSVDYWMPVGYPWQLLDATAHLIQGQKSRIEGTVEAGAVIRGTLVLPKSSTILAGCCIEGNLIVGENVVIGPQAHICGNTVMGDDTRVGFCCEVSDSILGENVVLMHGVSLAYSILGKDITLGAHTVCADISEGGSTVQSLIKGQLIDTRRTHLGAIIGDSARIAPATTIYAGRKVWPGKKTSPGEIIDHDSME